MSFPIFLQLDSMDCGPTCLRQSWLDDPTFAELMGIDVVKGLGLLLENRQVRKVLASYVGENRLFARQYLDGELVKTVDTYGATKTTQEVFYEAAGLPADQHTLKIEVTGTKNASATGSFVVIDAIDLHPTAAPKSAR